MADIVIFWEKLQGSLLLIAVIPENQNLEECKDYPHLYQFIHFCLWKDLDR